jgi:hypothetical protein
VLPSRAPPRAGGDREAEFLTLLDQLAPGETTRDRVAVESEPPAADRPEPDGFPGALVPNMSEAGSPPFAPAFGRLWGLLMLSRLPTNAGDGVPSISLVPPESRRVH